MHSKIVPVLGAKRRTARDHFSRVDIVGAHASKADEKVLHPGNACGSYAFCALVVW